MWTRPSVYVQLECDAEREYRVVRPFAGKCRARRQPGRCQKRLRTEIVTFIFYNSVFLMNKTTPFCYYHVYHLHMRLNPGKYFSSISLKLYYYPDVFS